MSGKTITWSYIVKLVFEMELCGEQPALSE